MSLQTNMFPQKQLNYNNEEGVKLNAMAELRKIPKESFHRCFQQWQDRWSKCVCVCVCVCVQGSYFEGD
jgi:hypothetical protein